MNQMLASILLEAAPGQGGGMSGIFMIIAMVVIFYFFMIRPQNKKQKEIKKAREALKKGDKAVTAGGIHGRIREISDDIVSLEIAPNVYIKIDKASIYPEAATVPAKGKDAKEDKKEEKASKEENKED